MNVSYLTDIFIYGLYKNNNEFIYSHINSITIWNLIELSIKYKSLDKIKLIFKEKLLIFGFNEYLFLIEKNYIDLIKFFFKYSSIILPNDLYLIGKNLCYRDDDNIIDMFNILEIRFNIINLLFNTKVLISSMNINNINNKILIDYINSNFIYKNKFIKGKNKKNIDFIDCISKIIKISSDKIKNDILIYLESDSEFNIFIPNLLKLNNWNEYDFFIYPILCNLFKFNLQIITLHNNQEIIESYYSLEDSNITHSLLIHNSFIFNLYPIKFFQNIYTYKFCLELKDNNIENIECHHNVHINNIINFMFSKNLINDIKWFMSRYNHMISYDDKIEILIYTICKKNDYDLFIDFIKFLEIDIFPYEYIYDVFSINTNDKIIKYIIDQCNSIKYFEYILESIMIEFDHINYIEYLYEKFPIWFIQTWKKNKFYLLNNIGYYDIFLYINNIDSIKMDDYIYWNILNPENINRIDCISKIKLNSPNFIPNYEYLEITESIYFLNHWSINDLDLFFQLYPSNQNKKFFKLIIDFFIEQSNFNMIEWITHKFDCNNIEINIDLLLDIILVDNIHILQWYFKFFSINNNDSITIIDKCVFKSASLGNMKCAYFLSNLFPNRYQFIFNQYIRFNNIFRKSYKTKINMYQYSNKKLMNSNYECSICFDLKNDMIYTNCDHIFCKNCIDKWLKKTNTCPLCRKNIIQCHYYIQY